MYDRYFVVELYNGLSYRIPLDEDWNPESVEDFKDVLRQNGYIDVWLHPEKQKSKSTRIKTGEVVSVRIEDKYVRKKRIKEGCD